MKTLADYIQVLPNVLSDEVCRSVLSEYANSNEWVDRTIDDNIVDKNYRDVSGISISDNNIINKNFYVRKNIDSDIFTGAKKVLASYNEIAHCLISKDYGYDLLKYEVGCFYTTHVDAASDISRTLSCSFTLNDEYEGGEWEFFNGEVKLKPPKGSAIVFPSNFLYPHAITKVTSGTRYSIVTWFI
jgi:predicted 2-oxoglutarate/Fe(II)-dependent dioxygenase YbiX